MKKSLIAILSVLMLAAGLSGCKNDADVASKNISTDADNFKIYRQIVVYNTFTDTIVLEIRGFCSLGNKDKAETVSYICKLEDGKYLKDIIKKSDNSFVFAHQLVGADASDQRFKVTFKPSTVIPDIDVR